MKNCVGATIAAGTVFALSSFAAHAVSVSGADKAVFPGSALKITDARPAEQQASDYTQLSHWVSSCSYGIYRLGDSATSPGKLELLKIDLEKSLGGQLNDKTLIVSSYVMYLNARQEMLKGNAFGNYATGGLIGSLMVGSFESDCTKEATPEGWYDPSEANAKASPVIVLISASIDGDNYAVRVVFSPSKPIGLSPEGDAGTAYANVLHRANMSLADKIRTRLELATAPESSPTVANAALPLGIKSAANVTSETVTSIYFRSDPHGVAISTLDPDGAGAQAGMRVGDVITAVDGRRVDSIEDLRTLLSSTTITGAQVQLNRLGIDLAVQVQL